MHNQLLKLKALRSDIFELKVFETKFVLFCRGLLVAELKTRDMIVVPHMDWDYAGYHSLYKLACFETVKYLRENNIVFKDSLEYIKDIPADLDKEIAALKKQLLAQQDQAIFPSRKKTNLVLVGGRDVPRKESGVIQNNYLLQSKQ